MFTGSEVSPPVGYSQKRFGKWREKTILTNNESQSKILVHGLLLEDVLPLQKEQIAVASQQKPPWCLR